MSLIQDIAQAYWRPAKVMRAQIDRGITDAQTLFYAILFGLMNLLANYPRAAANASDPDILAGMMGGLFISNIFFLPLMLFGFAGISHLAILKFFKGQGSWVASRRAFVWSAVVTIPFILIGGLTYILDNSTLPLLLNVVTAIVFIYQLWINLKVVAFL